MRWSFAVCAALLVIFLGVRAADQSSPAPSLGQKVADFTLADSKGKNHSLSEFANQRIVVLAFLGAECPLAKLYAPRLAKLAAEYQDRGVAFLGIDSNQQDAPSEIDHYVRVHGINFPVLKDLGNKLADTIGAQRTPEVYVLDQDRAIRYAGRVDDQYGIQDNVSYQLPEARRRDLAVALDELLSGKAVSVPRTDASGCLIGRIREPRADAEITYTKHIAPILNQNCIYCHREGQIAPFSLTSYDEVVGWAEMIDEVVQERRMPPWHADPRYGHFVNDARLSDADKETIRAWVKSGAPQGNPDDLPESPKYAEGWLIPEPDQVIYMRDEEYIVPAEGTVPYEHFTVDPGWTEDKWIKAIEPRPGNPSVVHHIVMYLVPPGGPKKGAAGQLRNDWFAAYAPGLRPQILPDGIARYAPAGSKLTFQMHYTPNGSEQKDMSYLGVVFADPKTVKKELAVKNAGNLSFTIPPHHDNYEVESEFVFRDDSLLWSVSPHMHVRGKDFLYTAIYPDGKRETLLFVPRYDFGWQTTYVYTEPKQMPKGTKLHCVAHFDNSEHNLNNPDPSATVRWGEQTWEEMMFGWFEMALADQDLSKTPEPIDRMKAFHARLEADGTAVDEQLRQTATRALDRDEDFKYFAAYLADRLPQLDRVCITYRDGEKLRVRAVEELGGLKTTLRSRSTAVTAEGQALTKALTAKEPVLYEDLSQAEGPIAKKMHERGLVCSAHFPARLEGRDVTVNFWSAEPKAFPTPAVEILQAVAQQLVAGR